jgi:adhesin transport system outer membrane protein
VQNETAQFSARFAEYRLLAATGSLLAYLDLAAPEQSEAYARDMLETPSVEDNGTVPVRKRKPIDFSAPIDLTKFVN